VSSKKPIKDNQSVEIISSWTYRLVKSHNSNTAASKDNIIIIPPIVGVPDFPFSPVLEAVSVTWFFFNLAMMYFPAIREMSNAMITEKMDRTEI
jgi:hypothetical protein